MKIRKGVVYEFKFGVNVTKFNEEDMLVEGDWLAETSEGVGGYFGFINKISTSLDQYLAGHYLF